MVETKNVLLVETKLTKNFFENCFCSSWDISVLVILYPDTVGILYHDIDFLHLHNFVIFEARIKKDTSKHLTKQDLQCEAMLSLKDRLLFKKT